jgi:hypothetical protein
MKDTSNGCLFIPHPEGRERNRQTGRERERQGGRETERETETERERERDRQTGREREEEERDFRETETGRGKRFVLVVRMKDNGCLFSHRMGGRE